MTDNMPTSEPDAPASTTGPSRPLAAELLATAELLPPPPRRPP